jgi:hypothetical protein
MLMVGAVFLLLAAYPVLRVIRLAMAQPPRVLSWKTDLVWAAVAIVVIVGLPLYMNEASRPRSSRVQADVRVLASAVSMYAQRLGTLPGSLDDLTTVTTVGGVTAGPFIRSIPSAPHGWTAYSYVAGADGTFTISTMGDGTSVIFRP